MRLQARSDLKLEIKCSIDKYSQPCNIVLSKHLHARNLLFVWGNNYMFVLTCMSQGSCRKSSSSSHVGVLVTLKGRVRFPTRVHCESPCHVSPVWNLLEYCKIMLTYFNNTRHLGASARNVSRTNCILGCCPTSNTTPGRQSQSVKVMSCSSSETRFFVCQPLAK